MECNKEEARRAKEIAEGKMQNKDFLGAKKVVLKAQQLFPDLENISQMLTVCEVHCCAAAMINGEKDWYRILQVEQAADESFIKKQYRKLALQLHPDKNKFAGAEAAFKLIGEAHMILSDREKRLFYDSKRRLSVATVPRQPYHQPTRPYFPKTHPGFPENFPSMASPNFVNINQQQSAASNSNSFWTACATCGQRYEYLRTLINRSLCCQRCLKYFTAHEVHTQAAPAAGANSTQPFPTQNFKQEIPGQQRYTGNSSNAGFKETVSRAPTAQNSGPNSGVNVAHGSDGSTSKDKQNGMAGNNVHFEKVNFDEGRKRKPQVKRSTVNAKRKRGSKSVVESSESSDSGGSTDSEDILDDEKIGSPAEPSVRTTTGHYPRRSNRAKQNVHYNEEAMEDEAFVSPKISKKNTDRVRNGKDANHTVDSSSNDSGDPTSFTYPDPEFGNFEGERVESKFEVGQIWAAYDTLDAMPRYYARITEVFTGKFRLRFNWLEHNAVNDTEIAWTDAELPVASGNYRLGKLEYTKSLQMFSHLMCWEKGKRKMTYDIYPRKGEVWALYKGWNVSWSSDAENHRLYAYEVVEVISDFTDGSKFFVVRDLAKIKGFQSLFVPAIDKRAYKISSAEVLRFSHKVPSYRLTGSEKEGALKGSLELDVASLPSDFADTFPSISLDSAVSKAGKFDNATINPCRSEAAEEDVGTCSKNEESKVENIDAVNGVAQSSNSFGSEHLDSPLPGPIDYFVSEFHDFEKDKSINKIKRGQIWAVYTEVDQYPKYYAKVKNVTKSTVKVSWIELVPRTQDEITWWKKGLPCACGRFKFESTATSFDIDFFSHMVQAVSSKTDLCDIYPRSGEVWALYKDWSVEWTQLDLENCDYDIVEVLEHTSSAIRVLVLTKVDGCVAVFVPERKGEAPLTLEIPLRQSLRFSHQIPAFRITVLESEKYQGCWELHSMSVPRKFM